MFTSVTFATLELNERSNCPELRSVTLSTPIVALKVPSTHAGALTLTSTPYAADTNTGRTVKAATTIAIKASKTAMSTIDDFGVLALLFPISFSSIFLTKPPFFLVFL